LDWAAEPGTHFAEKAYLSGRHLIRADEPSPMSRRFLPDVRNIQLFEPFGAIRQVESATISDSSLERSIAVLPQSLPQLRWD
jgi:hypothetical protein